MGNFQFSGVIFAGRANLYVFFFFRERSVDSSEIFPTLYHLLMRRLTPFSSSLWLSGVTHSLNVCIRVKYSEMSNTKTENTLIIRITHYISPQQFYFAVENGSDDEALRELSEYCQTMFELRHNVYVPKVGDLVGVIVMSKWQRARVDHVLISVARERECIVWLIDEGMPFVVAAKRLLLLPNEYEQNPEPNVYVGGLAPIVPIKEVCSYASSCSTDIT